MPPIYLSVPLNIKNLKKMIALLRPGYNPPTCKKIGGVLLENIYRQKREKSFRILEWKTVNMSLDGWSNVHNEPIICATVYLLLLMCIYN